MFTNAYITLNTLYVCVQILHEFGLISQKTIDLSVWSSWKERIAKLAGRESKIMNKLKYTDDDGKFIHIDNTLMFTMRAKCVYIRICIMPKT